ncbi:MAG TPA: Holliday junction branch migration protein RuvA, partial [Modicisalibacter sp.]|nr:Holliday junction branch migration protein RuvA [Modicisalibacter sp.]
KTAERLIVEMRDRFPHWSAEQNETLDVLGQADEFVRSRDPLADAEAALISLGYKPTEASRLLSGLDAKQPTEALIKAALTRQMAG